MTILIILCLFSFFVFVFVFVFCFCFFAFFCDPLIGVACESVYPLGFHTAHWGTQAAWSVECATASLRLCLVYVSAISVYFWTPKLLLGHPGTFRSTHDLKCIRTQTGPRFHVPSQRRGTTTWVVHPYPTRTMPGPGFECVNFDVFTIQIDCSSQFVITVM